MIQQLVAKLSRLAQAETAPDTQSPVMDDVLSPEPLVLHNAIHAPAPGYDPHHIIEVVDELIGHMMDNGRFSGCMVELDGFDCGVLDDGIETAVHEDHAIGVYVAEDVCALSLKGTDAYTVSHVAVTTLFRHRTERTPKWEESGTLTGKSFCWIAPVSDMQSLLITCTDEPIDPMCDGSAHKGASLFLQLVAQH